MAECIFVEKRPFCFKPTNASVNKKGAFGQETVVFGQLKGNNKPKEMHFCYLYGKKGHVAKNIGRMLVNSLNRLNPPVRERGVV